MNFIGAMVYRTIFFLLDAGLGGLSILMFRWLGFMEMTGLPTPTTAQAFGASFVIVTVAYNLGAPSLRARSEAEE